MAGIRPPHRRRPGSTGLMAASGSVGTVIYRAPEQIRGEHVDAATDTYGDLLVAPVEQRVLEQQMIQKLKDDQEG